MSIQKLEFCAGAGEPGAPAAWRPRASRSRRGRPAGKTHPRRRRMETRRSILRAGGTAGALGALVLSACAGARSAGGASGPPDAAGLTASLTYLGNHNQAEAQVVQPQLEGFSQRFPRARVQVTNL